MRQHCPWLFDSMGWVRPRFIVLAIAVLVVVLVLGALAIRRQACATASAQLRRPTSFHVPGGCFVGIGHGQKVPLGNYNAFRDAR